MISDWIDANVYPSAIHYVVCNSKKLSYFVQQLMSGVRFHRRLLFQPILHHLLGSEAVRRE